MFQPNRHSYLSVIYPLLLLLVLALLVAPTHQATVPLRRTLDPRAQPPNAPDADANQPLTGPSQLQTTQTFAVVDGTVTQVCVVTLTPVTINGQNLVQEVSQCQETFTPADADANDNQPPPPPASSAAAPPASSAAGSSSANAGSTSANTNTASSSASATSTDSAAAASSASASSSSAAAASSSSAAAAAASSSSAAAASSSSAAAASSSAAAGNGNGNGNGNASSTAAPATSGAPTSAAAAAAGSTSSTSSAPDTTAAAAPGLPGKKLQVLPIGLGVFAGISVIALIVVGLVTYERTKYRKAFRQRRLAADASGMGYGGMAQRQ